MKKNLYAGLNPQDFCCGTVLQEVAGTGIWKCLKCNKKYIFDYTGQRFLLPEKKRKLSRQEEMLSVSV